MKQSKEISASAAHDDMLTILNGLAVQIPSTSLSRAERKKLYDRNAICPDALIEMLAHLAEQSGGHVLGMPFDAAEARAVLAKVSATKTAIGVARQLVQRLEDDLVQQRATVADPAFALFTALRRLVNTKAGNKLAAAYAQMKQIVKDRPRKSRKKKAAAESGAAPG
jgi:hypothetical protein